jgi:formylglycine-generating enzyme required for sulfatase activity
MKVRRYSAVQPHRVHVNGYWMDDHDVTNAEFAEFVAATGYATWLRRGEFQRVLQEVVALRTEPPLQRADKMLRTEVAAEGERLLGFYEAGLYAYAGERVLWASALRRVLDEDGNNPYYRSIGGEQ